MADQPQRCLLIADFNTANLQSLLANDAAPPVVEVQNAPFGQVADLLIDAGHECWQGEPDSVLVWTQPQALIGGFARLLAGEEADVEHMLLEVDQYCEQLRMAAGRVRHVFVATWVLPPHHRGLGMIDLTHAGGAGGALLRMNARLVQNLAGERNLIVL